MTRLRPSRAKWVTESTDDAAARSLERFLDRALDAGVSVMDIVRAARVASHRVPYGEKNTPGVWEMAVAAELTERSEQKRLAGSHRRFLCEFDLQG